jgi:outer membrane protein OmpA-like peptidoglycan-associated protein
MNWFSTAVLLFCITLGLSPSVADAKQGCETHPEKEGEDASWSITFAPGASELPSDSFGLLYLQNLETVLKICPDLPVKLVGFGDVGGEQAANVALADKRLAWVQSYLTGRGIAAARISKVNRAATSFGRKSKQVDIWYESGSR